MRKFFGFLLIFVLAFVFFACGKKDVAPTGITITCKEVSVEVDNTISASVKVTPDDATNKNVVWSSSDESIATVKNGKIKGVAPGEVVITAKCEADENVKDSVNIKVVAGEQPTEPQKSTEPATPTPVEGGVESIQILAEATNFVVDNKFTLSAALEPSNLASDHYDLEWSVDDEELATITRKSVKTAEIECLAIGEVTVTVLDKISNVTTSLTIEIEDHPTLTGIKLSNDREINVGENCVIQVTTEPLYSEYECIWTSSEEGIATVDETGKVIGIAPGSTVITATTAEGFTATCNITVIGEITGPESVTIITGFEEVYIGYSVKFMAQVGPSGVSQEVTWISNNESVGVIDNQGNFTAIAAGTTRIRAISVVDDSVKSSFFSVTVKEVPVENIPDLQGYNIVIMNAASALNEHDPFLETYSSLDKSYKQEAWREIESKYNCTISVVAYPDDAPWGTARVNWIKTNAEANSSILDFGVLSTAWLPQLVTQTFSSLIDCTDFFGKYGYGQVESALKDASTYNGRYYAMSSGLTVRSYPNHGLFYNVKLIERLNIESPAKLFNDGEWTYSKFKEYCLAAKAIMEEDEYAIAGSTALTWWGMVNASGVKLADSINLKLNIKHQYSYEALGILQQIYAGGAWDPANTASTDSNVTSFQEGKTIFQPAEYWFVRASNRFPTDMWGEDTRYGYVPFPYPDDVKKEDTRTNWTGESVWMMVAGKVHPAGVEYEGIYQACIDMFLTTIKKMESDPLFDKQATLETALLRKVDDPESIKATLYFTADKTIFDPYFDGSFQSYDGGVTVTALNSILTGGSPGEFLEGIYNEVDTAFKKVFSN